MSVLAALVIDERKRAVGSQANLFISLSFSIVWLYAADKHRVPL